MGIPAVATLAVATVVPGAAALSRPGDRVATTDDAAGASSAGDTVTASRADGMSPEASRAYVRTVSRSITRTGAELPTLTEVEAVADRVAPLRLRARWLTDDVLVWSGPARSTDRLTALDDGTKVQVTGLVHDGWAQIRRNGRMVWVRRDALAAEKPEPAAGPAAAGPAAAGPAAGVTYAPCSDGSSVESGLTSNAVKVYRAVCAAFPAVSSWGGNTGYGNHGAGLALDIMCTGALGDAIAAWVRAHAGELGVSEVIWSQQIWTVERSGDGWRYMSDRGSATANHYDHVHVTVF
jgi:hypothetical protein